MNSNRIEYFMNVMLYFAWLHEKHVTNTVHSTFNKILYFTSYIFLGKKYARRNYINIKKSTKNKLGESGYKDLKKGFYINKAKYWFEYFSAGYPALISFIILGVVLRAFNDISKLSLFLIVAIPIGLSCIPDHKYIYSKDKYIEYFRQFNKKDEQWHKKWKRISRVYFIGGILSYPLGAFIGLAIAML